MGFFEDLQKSAEDAYNGVTSSWNEARGLPSVGGIKEMITGEGATNRAIDAQTNAANQANATAKEIYQQQRADLEPWRQTGMRALAGLESGKFFLNDPGYQFRLEEGNKAINAAAAARGNAGGGATMKALTRYGQDYAANEYQNSFNRLSTLAGLGQAANQTGVNASGQYGQTVSANQMGLGNAQAAAQIAQANRQSQLLGQGITGAALLFSDERLKTNINSLNKSDINEMKKHLKAYAFNYVNDEFGQGDWVGVMAQDLEKSKLGRTLVFENEKGQKQIDLKKVLSMFLATLAEA